MRRQGGRPGEDIRFSEDAVRQQSQQHVETIPEWLLFDDIATRDGGRMSLDLEMELVRRAGL